MVVYVQRKFFFGCLFSDYSTYRCMHLHITALKYDRSPLKTRYIHTAWRKCLIPLWKMLLNCILCPLHTEFISITTTAECWSEKHFRMFQYYLVCPLFALKTTALSCTNSIHLKNMFPSIQDDAKSILTSSGKTSDRLYTRSRHKLTYFRSDLEIKTFEVVMFIVLIIR